MNFPLIPLFDCGLHTLSFLFTPPSQGTLWCCDLVVGFPWRKERLRCTFTPNGKREFVQRDQVFPLLSLTVYYFYSKVSSFAPVLYITIVFLSAYFLFWEILYLNLTFPVCLNVTLNLSNIARDKEISASSRRLMKNWPEYFYEFPHPLPLAFNAFHASC